jgi:hypothetical protein
MTKRDRICHEFVEFVPEQLDDGVVYISVGYATAQHLCLCGCGNTVVTPLSPTDWRLTFDGETVSLWPSIGNWSFDCQSHYWIERNHVRWSRRLSSKEIADIRARDQLAKTRFAASVGEEPSRQSRLRRLLRSVRRTGEG